MKRYEEPERETVVRVLHMEARHVRKMDRVKGKVVHRVAAGPKNVRLLGEDERPIVTVRVDDMIEVERTEPTEQYREADRRYRTNVWLTEEIEQAQKEFARAGKAVAKDVEEGSLTYSTVQDLIARDARKFWMDRLDDLVESFHAEDHVQALDLLRSETLQTMMYVRSLSQSTSQVSNLMALAQIEAAAEVLRQSEIWLNRKATI